MFRLVKSLDWPKKSLSEELKLLLTDGFVIQEECYFLKKLHLPNTSTSKKDFVDKTGYECFVNSIHTDDYVTADFVIQAYLFLDEIFKRWNSSFDNLTLRGIISQTEFGANVKFHVVRGSEKWIIENQVENFEDALIISESR